MEHITFDRICVVLDKLIANNQKLTVNNAVISSLFVAGGTLAGYEKEVAQVIKMYTKGINEFEYTYNHNNKTDVFTLNVNKHGVMCLGFKTSDGCKYYQCAMDRHLDEQMRLLVVLSKTSTDELMQNTFIPNNIRYCNKYAENI